MNQDQLASLVRWAVTGVCGWLLSKGWIDQSWIDGIIAVALAVAALGWSMYTHTPAQKIRAVTGIDPAVKVYVPTHLEAKYPSIQQLADANVAFKQVVTDRD